MQTTRVAAVLGALALSLTLAGVYTSHAQRRGREGRGGEGRGGVPAPNTLLASSTSLKCSFLTSAAATWQAGEPRVQVKNGSDRFVLTITDIDTQEGTAQAAGLGALAHVTVKLAGANLHVLDIRPAGSLAITTVFSQESHDGRLKAVHSRTDYLGMPGFSAEPTVSQYYGDCAVGP